MIQQIVFTIDRILTIKVSTIPYFPALINLFFQKVIALGEMTQVEKMLHGER